MRYSRQFPIKLNPPSRLKRLLKGRLDGLILAKTGGDQRHLNLWLEALTNSVTRHYPTAAS